MTAGQINDEKPQVSAHQTGHFFLRLIAVLGVVVIAAVVAGAIGYQIPDWDGGERLQQLQIDILQVVEGRAVTYDELFDDLYECTVNTPSVRDSDRLEAFRLLVDAHRIVFKFHKLAEPGRATHLVKLYYAYGPEPSAQQPSVCSSANEDQH